MKKLSFIFLLNFLAIQTAKNTSFPSFDVKEKLVQIFNKKSVPEPEALEISLEALEAKPPLEHNDTSILKPANLSTIFSDYDVYKNRVQIKKHNLKAGHAVFTENNVKFKFNALNTGKKGPTIFVLHDDENAAFDAGLNAITKYGGKMIFLETGDQRLLTEIVPKEVEEPDSLKSDLKQIDPNRIFGDEYPKYTAFVESLVQKNAPVISFHTNADGHDEGTGTGTVSINRYVAAYPKPVESIVSFKHGGDEDDLVWIASRKSLDKNTWALSFVNKMKKSGINVVFEHVRGNDGSFSNWAAAKNIQYYNLEAEHFEEERLDKMVDAVLPVIGFDQL